MTDPRDKHLGLDRKIERRDFLNGVVGAVGAGLFSPRALSGLEADDFAPEKPRPTTRPPLPACGAAPTAPSRQPTP